MAKLRRVPCRYAYRSAHGANDRLDDGRHYHLPVVTDSLSANPHLCASSAFNPFSSDPLSNPRPRQARRCVVSPYIGTGRGVRVPATRTGGVSAQTATRLAYDRRTPPHGVGN